MKISKQEGLAAVNDNFLAADTLKTTLGVAKQKISISAGFLLTFSDGRCFYEMQ